MRRDELKKRSDAIRKEEESRREAFWQSNPDLCDQEQQDVRCDLCGTVSSGYPWVWWTFPASDSLRSMRRTGGVPEYGCPFCYERFRILTEVQGRPGEEVLLKFLKDRNWHHWLEALRKNGRNGARVVEGPSRGQLVYVFQYYIRGIGDEEFPSNDFFAVPTFGVAIADEQISEWDPDDINMPRVEENIDYSIVIKGEDNLRAYIRNPEAWQAALSEGDLLTIEQAAERLGITKQTTYDYCTGWYAYGEYRAHDFYPDGEEEHKPKKKTRKLFNIRTPNGKRVPAWAVELFKMQYENAPLHAFTTSAHEIRLLFARDRVWIPEKLQEERVTWTPYFELVPSANQYIKQLTGTRSDDPEWDTPSSQKAFETWLQSDKPLASQKQADAETSGQGVNDER